MSDPADEIVCYCFSHTRADIERDYHRNGRSLLLEEILAAKRLGACRCAVQNPKGT